MGRVSTWHGGRLEMLRIIDITKQGKRHSQKFNIESSIYHISSVCLSYIVFFTALMRDAFDSQSVVFYPEIVFYDYFAECEIGV